MPVIKSAKKKLRKDKKRTLRNNKLRALLDSALKLARRTPSDASVRKATQIADKAAKNHLIHSNKASRIKSALSKILAGKSTPKKTTAETKTVSKKPAKKKSK